jgi:hypothetical protein
VLAITPDVNYRGTIGTRATKALFPASETLPLILVVAREGSVCARRALRWSRLSFLRSNIDADSSVELEFSYQV